jgi:hypothetical protein
MYPLVYFATASSGMIASSRELARPEGQGLGQHDTKPVPSLDVALAEKVLANY